MTKKSRSASGRPDRDAWRRGFATIAAGLVVAACASSPPVEPTAEPPEPPVMASDPSDDEPVSVVPQRLALPIAIDRLAPQSIQVRPTRFDVLELDDGTTLALLFRSVLRFDARLRHDRVFPQLDEAVVPSTLRSTSAEPRAFGGQNDDIPWDMDGSSERFRCDRTFRRCVVATSDNDRATIAIHAEGEGAPTHTFSVTRSELHADGGTTGAVLRVRSWTRGRSFDGSLVAVTLVDTEPHVCVFDLARNVRLSCGEFYGHVEGLLVDAESNRVCVVDYRGLVCRDPAAIGTADPDRPPLVATLGRIHGGFFSGTIEGARRDLRIVHLGSGRTWEMPYDMDRWIVFDRDTFAILEATRVRVFHRDGTEREIVLDEPIDVSRPQSAAIVDRSVYVLDRRLGLVRIRPWETPAVTIGPRPHADVVLGERGGSFAAYTAGRAVTFDARGIVAADVPPFVEPTEVVMRGLGDVDPPIELEIGVALAPDPARDEVVYVADGSLHVVDRSGTELREPIRLPRGTSGAVCDRIQYFSDVDVAISGPAPCNPTRIHLPNGRTSPLGRARFDADLTPDRSRALLLANRRLLLVDGHSGETLARFDPPIEHLRGVFISPDGRHGGFDNGADEWVLELTALVRGEVVPAMRILPLGPGFEGSYLPDADLAVTCDSGRLRFARPSDPSSARELTTSICDDGRSYERFTRIAIPGFVGIGRDGWILLVRLADSATLEFSLVASTEAIAILERGGDRIVGVHPDDSPMALFRADDGSLATAAPTAADFEERVRRFFTPP